MTSSSRGTTQNLASFDQDLAKLRYYLLPRPQYTLHPSALQLFARFQLLSNQVIAEARVALELQTSIVESLEEDGIPLENWIMRGSLTKTEGKKVKSWSRRDEDEVLYALSLEIRKFHIAKLLSKPATNLDKTLEAINLYFPETSTARRQNHSMLFVRSMDRAQSEILAEYRKDVMKIYTRAVSAYELVLSAVELTYRKGRGPPALSHILSDSPAEKFGKLTEKLLREAERCLMDAKEFALMFAEPVEESSEGRLQKDNRSSGSGSGRGFGRTAEIAQREKRRRTMAHAPSRTNDSDQRINRSRTSLPVALTHRHTSPTPEELASMRRIDFGTRPSVTRSSVGRTLSRSPIRPDPPIEQKPLFTEDHSIEVGNDDYGLATIDQPVVSTSHDAATQRGAPPIYASASIIASSGLKSSPQSKASFRTNSTPATKSSMSRKKRTSDLPPLAGPDFTAALPTPTRSPGDMRPFSSAELLAGKRKSSLAHDVFDGDENSPRQAKRRSVVDGREVLGEDSQENSQDSVGGLEISKQGQGKRRLLD